MRIASANTSILRTAIEVAPEEVDCRLYDRLATLPAFNPDADRDPLDEEVRRLRESIHGAHGILFSTPEYAGALPGSFKNLLDWTIGDDQPGSIYEKPVGWVNTSPRGATDAYRELRAVLGYAHASLVETACVAIPVASAMIGADGLVADVSSRHLLAGALNALVRAITESP